MNFSLFLNLFQEELRELREQPIDPQAEQEIIESIEEVYFSTDSFDMVQHELEVRSPLNAHAVLTELATLITYVWVVWLPAL